MSGPEVRERERSRASRARAAGAASRGTPTATACRMCGEADPRPAGEVRGFRFAECGRCGFVFAPALTAQAMARLYREGYHGPENGAPTSGWANTEFLEPTLARLEARAPLRILDLGTGQSRVPELLRGRGHRVIAADVVPPLRPHPDRLTGSLSELGLPAAHFDLAFAFQVIEHLPEPRPQLEELLRVTRPGGLVLLHTDMEVPERAAGLEEWWYVMPPDHCSFFRHGTFEVFLEATPHRIVDREPKSVTIVVGAADSPDTEGTEP